MKALLYCLMLFVFTVAVGVGCAKPGVYSQINIISLPVHTDSQQ